MYGNIGSSIDAKGNLVAGISGTEFAYEMQHLQKTCNKINVHINSAGGSVLEGYSIVSGILNSPVPVHTYIDGLAASIAGVIALAGTECHVKDYGTWMGHEVAGGEDERVQQLAKDTLVTILTNRIKKTPDEINAMLAKETWISNSKRADFTLEQGVQMGFFTDIIPTKKKVSLTNSIKEMELVYNRLLTPEKDMKKITNKLALSEDASEDSIVSEIEKRDAKILELTNKLADVAAKEAIALTAAKTELTNKATELATKLVNEGKIKEEEKAGIITNAAASLDSFKFIENTFSKVTGIKTASKIFDVKNYGPAGGQGEDRSTWGHKEWCKNDPDGLLALGISNPEFVQALVNKLPQGMPSKY